VTKPGTARPIGRLAVIDPTGNAGGGTRFLRALLPAFRRVRPELAITFLGNASSIARDDIANELRDVGIQVTNLDWTRDRPWKSIPLATRGIYKLRRRVARGGPGPDAFLEANLAREIEQIDGSFDLAYFPWPYRIPTPRLQCAVASTIHDLNFKYFFGSPIYSQAEALRLDRDIGDWLRISRTITSSRFMADEIARFYPAVGPVPVIRLASFAEAAVVDEPSEAAGRIELEKPYILCPTQLTVHKNVGSLIAAQARLRERFPRLKLILTGFATEMASGRSSFLGSVRGGDDPDVIGLGYVSNREMNQLIEGAAVVVNPSLYEAGNGSGLDAWSRGAPVAMSNISSFTEHLAALGVEAALFDPRDPDDIAAKLADVLDHPDVWVGRAARSKTAIDRRTWGQVAAEYLDVFDAAAASVARA
jgi:glycosyltransferase involved in cell wall biosynthesis